LAKSAETERRATNDERRKAAKGRDFTLFSSFVARLTSLAVPRSPLAA
jgi:hypothetical protein